jgi:nitrogen fixation-related uncharacterized protein
LWINSTVLYLMSILLAIICPRDSIVPFLVIVYCLFWSQKNTSTLDYDPKQSQSAHAVLLLTPLSKVNITVGIRTTSSSIHTVHSTQWQLSYMETDTTNRNTLDTAVGQKHCMILSAVHCQHDSSVLMTAVYS